MKIERKISTNQIKLKINMESINKRIAIDIEDRVDTPINENKSAELENLRGKYTLS